MKPLVLLPVFVAGLAIGTAVTQCLAERRERIHHQQASLVIAIVSGSADRCLAELKTTNHYFAECSANLSVAARLIRDRERQVNCGWVP